MLVGIEADTDLYHPPAVGDIRLGIAAGLDLLEGVPGRVADFQFHDIDGVGHEDDHVHAGTRHLHLRARIDVEHGEDEVEGVFIEPLLRLCLGELLLETLDVGDAREIRLHVPHGKVYVALLEGFPELRRKTDLHVAAVQARVGGQQTIDIAYAHLLVGDGKVVGLRVGVVVLDGEVSALIEQWQGILHVLRRLVERRLRHVERVERGDVGMEMLQLPDEEGRRARGKPVVLQLAMQKTREQAERVIHLRRVGGKMITVVLLFELVVHLLG